MSRFSRITGTGSYLPPRRLSNAELVAELAAKGVESSDDWIVERTGIRARHYVADGVNASDLALQACLRALEAAGRLWIPETKDWRLNERHYGGLTGLDKAETAAKHGDEQVKVWRRSFDIPPPPLDAGSEWDLASDPRYAGIAIPSTESLKDITGESKFTTAIARLMEWSLKKKQIKTELSHV